jgi:tetratricopeptide (TPR) repeat protein
MSPEQAAGRLDSLDATSDIFSLGATLYQVLTGQAPFRGNEEEVLGNVQLVRFDRPRKVNPYAPRALEAICLKAMARMPRERYQSAREMADDLERFLGDERVLAYHEPLPARAWRWVRNHKVLVTGSAAALAVTATTLTIGVLLLSAANLRERAERERAEENFAEATRQRNLAEKNFALARSAVHDYFVTVSEDTLLQQPGMQPLREELLRQALVYYQSFLEQRQDDPELRQEVAEANFYAGSIVQAIESPQKALTQFEQAAKIWKELLGASPDNLSHKGSYAQVENAIGGVHLRAGRIEKARGFFQQSATLRQELAEAEPDDVESARTYANSLMNVGNTFGATGQWDRAVELFEQAQMIRVARLETLAQPDPKLQRDLAMGHYNLAVVGSRLGEDDVAERNFLAASKIFEELLSAESGEMSHQRNLAACYRGLADLKVALEQPEEAVKYFLSAGKLLDELRIRNPEVHNYAFELAGVNINLARQYRLLGQNSEGLAAASRGVELLEGLSGVAQTMPTYRRDWGVALRLLGELLADTGDLETALQRLADSQAVFSKLLQENPASEEYAHQLGLTVAAQEAVQSRQDQPEPEPTE